MGKKRKSATPPTNRFANKKLLRDLLVIFLVSFFISTAINIYLFGFTDDFFSRMFWSLLVVFILISSVVLAIIPFVNRLVKG